eukprot:CAMPEP_0171970854 /NCGR_PEP_ID=MMETSP0993-20121228/214876_1 /TAXON_ID=483369 /ORGANISM="non described non described, Strain CCMP2098" /LENGTH=336 /DNA_ID=CAMNT_0012621047 /DNA_START=35 /DNA_END=1045 /DNA_ORIENTATION=+
MTILCANGFLAGQKNIIPMFQSKLASCGNDGSNVTLFETFLWHRPRGFVRRQLHLNRFRKSLEEFFDVAEPDLIMQDAARALDRMTETSTSVLGLQQQRVRLSVLLKQRKPCACQADYPWEVIGPVLLTTARHQILEPQAMAWRLRVSHVGVDSQNCWLGVKTSRRELYDQTRKELTASCARSNSSSPSTLPEVDEVLFLNEHGEVCEGTITSVFANLDHPSRDNEFHHRQLNDLLSESSESTTQSPSLPLLRSLSPASTGGAAVVLVTPPLRCGCLPGVLRQELLNSGVAREQVLSVADLRVASRSKGLWVGNSLRGLVRAVLVEDDEREDCKSG